MTPLARPVTFGPSGGFGTRPYANHSRPTTLRLPQHTFHPTRAANGRPYTLRNHFFHPCYRFPPHTAPR